jgi:hypothetical protein
MSKSGVYTIYNVITHKFYIGSSINLRKRHNAHLKDLRNNRHHCNHLQNAWNKYGKESFIFKTIRTCPPDQCVSLEQYFINAVNPEYNVCKVAGSCLGRTVSIETRNKMSNSQKGKKASEETRRKLRENIGKPIIQYDLQMNKIAEHISISEASRITGIHLSAIAHTLKGQRKTSGGYKWKYKNKNNGKI